MHTIFTCLGKLRIITDASGNPTKHEWERPVFVHAKYELHPSPRQPLVLEIYGYNLVGLDPCVEKLTLDNGVVLNGRTNGGSLEFNTGDLRKIRMFDVKETLLQLYPDRGNSLQEPEIDSVIFGVVSSKFLGTSGWAKPGLPFSYVEGEPPRSKKNVRWSPKAFRIVHGEFEITFVGTTRYWKRLVNKQSLQHEMVVGIRKKSGGAVDWESINEIISLLPKFLGWVNHCVSPVFHVKAYRKGKLVYRGYNLYPHPTVQRDWQSWLPHGQGENYQEIVENMFGAFTRVWKKNYKENGVFHFALQLLRSQERGVVPLSKPSLFYLRDTFGAISILTTILVGANPNRGRHGTMVQCVKKLNIEDLLPLDEVRKELIKNHPDLWRAQGQNGAVQEGEREKGKLCRPVANVGNWLLHLDDPANAKRIVSLHNYQFYFVEVSIWLADLMLMKVVGHNETYFNRIRKNVEMVPWKDIPER